MANVAQPQEKFALKDYKAAEPRWCTGCGDYGILVALRRFMADAQLNPSNVVNISGIGCSGRMPHYLNTFGVHSIHGRAIPVATGIALGNPNLKLFIESGDGDALSIGGNHLIHGINKNFNCVFVLMDNQIYGLTKNQTSPTTRQGLPTNTQPQGSWLKPINPVQFAMGLGASFVASTAEWLTNHMVDVIEAAFNHKGFSFVHIAQRCPKFNPTAWEAKSSSWFAFAEHENGVKADTKFGPDASVVAHDPTNLGNAFQLAMSDTKHFGVIYKDENRACYDEILHNSVKKTPQAARSAMLDRYRI
jgi:2-oxoglutarate/2-oxoacid ferredoxin oxidoreductase subunit beta